MGDVLEIPMFQQYIASFYYSMTTLTTVGYGDITPHNTVEQVTAVCFMACGVVFFAFLVRCS
jgi:voltage-gated potassium channel